MMDCSAALWQGDDFAALAARADYRRHRVGAQINCNYIISVFHFSALYLAYSFLHL